MKRLGIDRLGSDERLALLEEIWDSLDQELPSPTEAQALELDRRLADHKAHPDDAIPWEVVKKMPPPTGGK
jgi:putative addiction module component (TIGR02574 family)